MSSFLKIVGKIGFEEMSEANNDIAVVILFVFAIIFFFILINMFIAIVMSNYAVLRKSSQLKTEANAKIAEEEGANWTKRLFRFILCTPPEGTETAEKKDVEKPKGVDAAIDSKNQKKEITNQKLTLWNTMCMNLNALCSSKPTTNEKIKNRQMKAMETLRREQLVSRISEKKILEREIIGIVVQAVIYVVFIALYITMVLLQINISDAFLANNAMQTKLNDIYDKYEVKKIGALADIPDFISGLYMTIYSLKEQEHIANNIVVFSNPFIRITMNRNKIIMNTKEATMNAVPYYMHDNSLKTTALKDDYVRPMNYTDPSSNDVIYRYYPPGDPRTYKSRGGVVMYVPYDQSEAEVVFNDLKNSVNLDFNEIDIEILTYVPNSLMFTWTTVAITYKPSGDASAEFITNSFRGDQYHTTAEKGRIALEIIVILFILYFSFNEIRGWVLVFIKVRTEDHLDCPKAGPEDGSWNKFLIILYIEPKSVANESAGAMIFIILYGCLKVIFHITKQLLLATYYFVFKSFFEVITVAALIITYLQIFNWYFSYFVILKGYV